jgi:CheY-like chemotaxis protein
MALARQLENQGMYVMTAASGYDALARLNNEGFNVIVVDMWMPESNWRQRSASWRNANRHR